MSVLPGRPRIFRAGAGMAVLVLGVLGVNASPAQAVEQPNSSRGPIEQYLMDRNAEIALARTAAPEAVSRDAAVLVLGARGYEDAAKGKNGFTCLVERSWAADFDDPQFWNPKNRSPVCFNAAATRSVLPAYRKRTEWVLSGASEAEILQRTRAAVAAKELVAPEVGAMCYMMSKEGYLNGADGPWHPHLMFYLPPVEETAWGAGLKGAPVFGGPLSAEPVTLFIVPVPNWSDGSSGPTGH